MKNSVPLRPMEMASIAVFGGLTVATVVIAAVIPMATAVGLLAPVPLALIAARTRPRALIAATVASTGVTFAMAGTGAATGVLGSAVIGGLVGDIKRRGRGGFTLGLWTIVLSPLIGGASVVVLLVLKPLRELMLETLDNTLGGIVHWMSKSSLLEGPASAIDTLRASMVDQWWVWVWASGTFGAAVSIIVAWMLLGPVLDRLADVPSEDSLASSGAIPTSDDVAPVPLTLEHVSFSYAPGAPQVLTDVSMRVRPAEFVAIVGANGSGKSTLAKILAGREPTDGVVRRPGLPGLGAHGGTALVLQRPEVQMLGSRVADDVVWGLPPAAEVDVESLLAEVGLEGLGGRETSDLSGGQQQRLAVAAALARDPALLIADEVTSMVDPVGREELIELLAALPRSRGVSVVLITHRGSEAARADVVVHLDRGRVLPGSPEWIAADGGAGARGGRRRAVPGRSFAETFSSRFRAVSGVESNAASARSRHRAADPIPAQVAIPVPPAVLALDGVGYTYLPGSPWEVAALQDISLSIHSGDGLLIVGGNGSGKTTLAWIMAGLIEPTRGTCLLKGEPVAEHVGEVGLAFQHSRLQLQKPTVGEEIMAAGGTRVGTAEVSRVLELVGLPREMAARRTDALSGGQMRRVVLASLIARRPEVLILDEPLAGLDPYARTEIIALLARLRVGGQTIVIISHDFESLESVCTRRIALVEGTLQPEERVAGPTPPPGAEPAMAPVIGGWS